MSEATHPTDLRRVQPVILAGGSGTRLWPLSRAQYPKQFLALAGADTLLQQTAARLPHGLVGRDPVVVANRKHRFILADQLHRAAHTPQAILLEPEGRNTAPAIAAATSWLGQQPGADDPVLAVMPADHVVTDMDGFRQAIGQAVQLAEAGWIVTLGVQPTHAETGFGYIERGDRLAGADGAYAIAAFKEKPDPETAQHYATSGRHVWNAGLFVGRQSVLAAELTHWAPAIAEAGTAAVAAASPDPDFVRLAEAPFQAAEAQPFDRAVMEHTTRGAVVDLAVPWSDLGTWESVWAIGPHDAAGNVISGDVYARESQHSYLRAESRLLATLGIDSLTVVETRDAVFVADRQRSQEVQSVVKSLRGEGRSEADTTVRQFAPWGYFENLDLGERFQVKRLMVHPGCRLAARRHYHRAEHWVVVSGTARVTMDGEAILLSENESTFIPVGTVHELENPGKMDLELIEVQSGTYLGPDDLERHENLDAG